MNPPDWTDEDVERAALDDSEPFLTDEEIDAMVREAFGEGG